MSDKFVAYVDDGYDYIENFAKGETVAGALSAFLSFGGIERWRDEYFAHNETLDFETVTVYVSTFTEQLDEDGEYDEGWVEDKVVSKHEVSVSVL